MKSDMQASVIDGTTSDRRPTAKSPTAASRSRSLTPSASAIGAFSVPWKP
jgi:hypothetical protein